MVHANLSSNNMCVGMVVVDVSPKMEKTLDFSSGSKSDPCSCLVGGAVKDSGTVFRHRKMP